MIGGKKQQAAAARRHPTVRKVRGSKCPTGAKERHPEDLHKQMLIENCFDAACSILNEHFSSNETLCRRRATDLGALSLTLSRTVSWCFAPQQKKISGCIIELRILRREHPRPTTNRTHPPVLALLLRQNYSIALAKAQAPRLATTVVVVQHRSRICRA